MTFFCVYLLENYSCLKYRTSFCNKTKQLQILIFHSMDAYEKGKDTEKKAKNLALRRERLAAMLRQERYRFEVSPLTDIIYFSLCIGWYVALFIVLISLT